MRLGRLASKRTGLLLFLLVIGVLIYFALQKTTNVRSGAQAPDLLEAELGVLSGAATIGSDAQASGGQFVQLGTIAQLLTPTPTSTPVGTATPVPTGSLSFQPTAPYYATFFYMWYKAPTPDGSWSYWPDHSNNPPNTWFSKYLPDVNPSAFDPANELYSANNYSVFKWQVGKMAESRQEVAIASWWGQGTKEDVAFNNIINDFMGRLDNPYHNLRWSIYYEDEGFSDPNVATLVSDLTHIKNTFTNSPYFLKINGKPVIFVYGSAADEPGTVVQRWSDANTQVGNAFYYVLKLFNGYATASPQPNSWHQYAPAVRSGQHGAYSYFVSPGFWLDDGVSAERLPRNAAQFESAVQSMVAANTTWKLTETWNEWGEGTSVEPGLQVRLNTVTGKDEIDPNGYPFGNLYVDILNRNLPPLEAGLGN